jgi:insulin receptor
MNCRFQTSHFILKQYLQRRCVTKEQCYELNNSVPRDSPNAAPFIPFQQICMPGCPSGYVDKKTDKGNETICVPCGNNCQKKCQSKIIDSIAAAQSLKGCSIIEGPLEIQIRSSTKTFDQTNNVVKELETSLSEIVEIQDYLKIARSFPIVSLSFLKKLKIIRGKRLESNKYSLVVWDNQNLQELWDENQEVNIENGKLFFHYNPKLCFFKIERLVKNSLLIENYEFAQKSNGDKTPCNVTKLEVTVVNILAHAALLNWKPLKLDDERSLLSYVVFYIAAPYQNITLWQNRDACGNDG